MPIITVKNLGKKYHIKHTAGGYVALRDVIANVTRHPVQFLKNKAKQAIGATKQEEYWALKDVNFEVEKGEVIGIIGANGAGKSTLLKILSQITPPTEGEIVISGRVASLLEVGTGFHPELTGRENIFLNGAILGMPKAEIARKFDAIVEFAGIGKFLDTPVRFYSSGMYVRLAFSVAAHLEPDILIIDEVLAVGDAEFQKKCLGKMKEVATEEGRTVLFVSHNMEAVESLCSRAILLNHGEVEGIGEVRAVISKYLKSSFNQAKELIWEPESAPANEFIAMRSIAVRNGQSPEGNLVITDPVTIHLEFECLEGMEEFNISLGLSSSSGIHVFQVITSVRKCLRGAVEADLLIPGNFLNDEAYSITLFFVNNSSTVVFKLQDIISFEVKEVARQGKWHGKWHGVVRPTNFSFDFTQ